MRNEPSQRWIVRVGAMAIAFGAVLACVSFPQEAIEEQVRLADSSEDHWRIVEHYREEAARAREDAAEHRRLAEVYGGRHHQGVPFAERASWHCNELAALDEERAARYELLATEHENMVQQ